MVAMETGGMERASPSWAVAAPSIILGGRETPGARRFVLWQGGRREGLFLLAPTSCAIFSFSKWPGAPHLPSSFPTALLQATQRYTKGRPLPHHRVTPG